MRPFEAEMARRTLTDAPGWDDLVAGFAWSIPSEFNIAQATIGSRATSDATAIIHDDGVGDPVTWTFADLADQSARLATVLAELGVGRGDRVCIYLPQRPEVVVAHLAAWKLAAVSLPLTTAFGAQALLQRLQDACPTVLVCERRSVDYLAEEVVPHLDPRPRLVVVDDDDAGGVAVPDDGVSWPDALSSARPLADPATTSANDAAFISYTSGTTGPAKGALHAHRSLLGHLPGFEVSHDLCPHPGDFFWTPADWAWIGGFMDVLFPALYFGLPVLAAPRRFDPEEAWAIAARHRVRNSFLPPTALRLMRQAHTSAIPATTFRSVASGGESLGADTLDWARRTLGCPINEFYGQTEVNLIVSNCAALFEARPGSMGRAVPGHEVTILDADLQTPPIGTEGELCVRADSPVAFLGYFNNPEATATKVVDGWIRTGDHGQVDDDGYLWFAARKDDVITSAGYRIGPGEIEQCLQRHPAVRLSAVIGVPDPVRTQTIKAFVQLRDDVPASDELAVEIRDFVRHNLAAHLYPRRVEFVDEIPLTATGKVIRSTLRAREDGA